MITITDKEFKKLSEYIEANYGIHLRPEKKAMVVGRLHKVVDELGFHSFTEYYNYLVKNHDAAKMFVDRITTNHTFFMREPEHFYFFRDKILPYLADKVKDKDLRIWCAASSSGEEPYTLAMILDEYFKQEQGKWDKKLLATDISSRVLEIAKKGVYSKERVGPLPTPWKTAYFNKYDDENMIVCNHIKNEIIYRKFNLMDTFPFRKKFHVIFCRNVMIYFDNQTKESLVERFYDILEDGGYLIIGHSEAINRDKSRFKYIQPAIYRKE